MNPTSDETEPIRRQRLAQINSAVESNNEEAERQRLGAQYGQVWEPEWLVARRATLTGLLFRCWSM
jgi:hypothetical protein